MAKNKSTKQGEPSAADFVADGLPYVFVYPSFIHQGNQYKSADVLAKAEAGDEAMLELIAELVKIGGTVEVKQKG